VCTAVNVGFSCDTSNVVLLCSVTAAFTCGASNVGVLLWCVTVVFVCGDSSVVCLCGVMTGTATCASCVVFFVSSGFDNI